MFYSENLEYVRDAPAGIPSPYDVPSVQHAHILIHLLGTKIPCPSCSVQMPSFPESFLELLADGSPRPLAQLLYFGVTPPGQNSWSLSLPGDCIFLSLDIFGLLSKSYVNL